MTEEAGTPQPDRETPQEAPGRPPVTRGTPQLDGAAEVIDQIISADVAGRGAARTLYQAARRVQGEPLAWRAARLLAQVREGDVVLLATGWPHRPHVSPEIGETDGPPGAAVLARTLAEVAGVLPLVAAEPSLATAVGSVVQAAGLRVVEPSALHQVRHVKAPLHVAGVAPMPVDEGEGRTFARDVLERYRPAAVVVVEKGGLNVAGRAHTSRGHDTSWALAKADLMVSEARERGIPTIAVGDGGNEVGMGLIKETVQREVPYGDRCQCPCGQGIAPEQPVDALVVAAVSNWGAYGVAAALATLKEQDWPHDAAREARVLEAAGTAGLCDGPTGWVGPVVDGMPIGVHQAVVALLGETARKARWGWR